MSFELRWEPHGVYRRYFGRVTIAERRRSLERICADPRFDELRFSITDYLGVDDYEITDESTREIAALHVGPTRTNPNIVIAAVAVQPHIVAAIRQFIDLRYIEQPYEIHPTLPAARAWIDTRRRSFKPPLRHRRR